MIKSSRRPGIYYILADIKRIDADAKDYAPFASTIELWIKATGKNTATALAKRWLANDGWSFKKRFLIRKVSAGFARVGSMLDPPVFSDQEADVWLEHFRIAEKKGLNYAFAGYKKSNRKPR